ncbi:MAG: PorT family protein [Bacteroidales bacterium]|nr:PorT family protein [Bacteroidales bacterium]
MLKFRLFVLIFCLGFFFTETKAQMTGGLKGGVNFSNIIITNNQGYLENAVLKTRYGYNLGSFLRNSFSNSFAWQIEFLFASKGFVTEIDNNKAEVSLNYLNWPLLLVYKASPSIGIEAGLEPGLLISGEPEYKGFDLGIDFGLSYLIKNKWLLGARYNQGLSFAYDIEKITGNNNPPHYQNSVLQVYIGYNILREISGQ